MTSRKDELQKLIADIDNLLNSSGKRLPKLLSSQAQEPKEVLERTRDFLIELQELGNIEHPEPTSPAGISHKSPLLEKFIDQGHNPPTPLTPNYQQYTHSLVTQLQNEFSACIQPLQGEVAALLQERAILVQEIRQLEQKRLHNYSLSQQLANQEQIITEFLQVLMSRLVPTLIPKIAETGVNNSIDGNNYQNNLVEPQPATHQTFWESSEQTERLTQLAQELDQRLLSLDGTVNVVFDSLQRNINTYHESLSQALTRMHSTGLQGEQLLINLLNNLAQNIQENISISSTPTSKLENETLANSLGTTISVTRNVSSPNHTIASTSLDAQPESTESLSSDRSLAADLDAIMSDRDPETAEFDAFITEELDEMLLQLGIDESISTENLTTPDIFSPDQGESTDDEVDLIYASLFGMENFTAILELTSESVIADLSEEDAADPAIPPQNVLTEGDTAAMMPDAWFDQSDPGFFDQVNSQGLPDPPLQEIDLVAPNQPSHFADELDLPAIPDSQGLPDPPLQEIDLVAPNQPSHFTDELDLPAIPDSQGLPDPPLQEIDLVAPNQPSHFTDELDLPAIPDSQGLPDPQLQEIDLVAPNQPSHFADELDLPAIPDSPLQKIDLVAPNQASNVADELDLPSYEDTITSLADLFADVDISELSSSLSLEETVPVIPLSTPEPLIAQQIAVTSALEDIPPAIETTVEPPPREFIHQEPEASPEHFIPASPQENLLTPEVNALANLPEISLNEEQWLKLHQDLAKLDESIPQPPVIGVESAEFWVSDRQQLDQEVAEHTGILDFFPTEVSPPQPISSPPSATTADFHQTEKKKEVTTTAYQSSLINPDTPIDNIEIAPESGNSVWYLGIDMGTTGISATLLNRATGIIYPICWSAEQHPGTNTFQQSFRLPAEVYLPNTSVPPKQSEDSENPASHLKNHLYSAQLKPYLQIAIPYKNDQQKWQPVLQFNEFSAGPLIWVVRSLSKLLLTLKADRDSTTQGLIATAVGLDDSIFHTIIEQIAGVICNCPSTWSEQYRFNVREALLTSRLVQHPQQVFFIEEAIASLLSVLNGAQGETVQFSTYQGLIPAQSGDCAIVGNTLAINIGAAATEMGIVDVPDHIEPFSHHDFMLHGFAYASKGIEQDIICQLLLPPKYRQSRGKNPEDSQKITSNPSQWQSAFPNLDTVQWQSLNLEDLELPRVGEPDVQARILLQQRLESSLLGQAVLDAALALKLILQRQESFSFELADQTWTLQRRDLETLVFVPFVRRLNRELNKLLVARGIPTEAINQAILTGGVATLAVVHRWLRQKLPNAKIIQDAYLGENGIPNCSRVAYGLAVLPLQPHVLEESRHQYTDYFLFTELLRLLPNRTLMFGEVLQLFEARGINTSSCQKRLLAFLEGEIPPGLIPVTPESTWLTQSSQANADYQAIAATSLFEKQGNLAYRPNFSQLQIVHRYLEAMKASTQQSLEEPYTINFGLRV